MDLKTYLIYMTIHVLYYIILYFHSFVPTYYNVYD